jgi:hypothetical protein
MAITIGKRTQPSIVGDVSAEAVTLNAKGGSLSAIIKQGIRGDLSAKGACFGANIEVEPGVSCLIVAPVRSAKIMKGRIRVQKLEHGVFISFDDGTGHKVDSFTQKVLSLYEELIKEGKVGLVSAEEVRAERESDLKEIDNLLSQRRARVKSPAI